MDVAEDTLADTAVGIGAVMAAAGGMAAADGMVAGMVPGGAMAAHVFRLAAYGSAFNQILIAG
jgi:hypothetical protein